MKKNILFVALLTTAVLFLASCKTHERCPAYGKVNSPAQKAFSA